MNSSRLKIFNALTVEPSDEEAYATWVRQEDIVPFLVKDGTDEDIIVYAGLPHVFIHAILIPRFEVTPESVAPLLEWNFNASSGWALTTSSNDAWIEQPLACENIPLIDRGEQIVFYRSFEGVRQKSSYFELNQKIAHVLGLHHLEDRDSWCKLDTLGDIDEIVKHENIGDRRANGGNVITMRRSDLAEYAGAGDYVVLRMFDFNRYRSGGFPSDEERASRPLGPSETVFGQLTLCGTKESFSRGVQILDLRVTKADIVRRLMGDEDDEDVKQFATFIAHDWKHRVIGEFSCDPKQLGNYFVGSSYPYETSPSFFRPEVLSKYKADPEKYTIEHRSVSCRGTWHLRGVGFNEAGQVHAYLGDLGELPYEEQLHWKQFNERPKAGLSRAIARRFSLWFKDCNDSVIVKPSLGRWLFFSTEVSHGVRRGGNCWQTF